MEMLLGLLVMAVLTGLDICKALWGFGWGLFCALYALAVLAFVGLNVIPCWKKPLFSRLHIMLGGARLARLSAFCLTLGLLVGGWCLFSFFPRRGLEAGWLPVTIHVLVLLLWCGLAALGGFVRMYLTSVQMGIKWRVLFLLFWWVPFVNLALAGKICRLVRREYDFETAKQELNVVRRQNEVCKTKYPILLVHGVFFRDRKYFNYWGRIPGELKRNGAEIFYGNQQSAAATPQSAQQLKERILEVCQETGSEKVNIIAHSKGGLESRWAVSQLGMAPYVASLTTINTPHEGCTFVDWLLEKMPKALCRFLARRYDGALRRLGDENPDFMAAVTDLTHKRCMELGEQTPPPPEVFCQSVGSQMKNCFSAPFPLNLCWLLVRFFEKNNDGLVALEAMEWGERFQQARSPSRRGLSHGDMIDLNRQNIPGFDVREFYVELVKDLKARGF